MENPAADQLPEAHSLPDGFVDSSADPLAPSTPSPEDEAVTDYKDEKLVETPGLLVNEVQLGVCGAEKTENARTFPVELSDSEGFDASKQQSEFRTIIPELGDSVSGVTGNQEKVQSSESSDKATNGSLQTQALRAKEVTAEAKRKGSKRSLKSEQEFLEFTLKYQQVIGERDAAITVRDRLESLCRELQRQNKMLMDECKRVSLEGQNLRTDLSNKFRDAIKEVSIKLEEQKDDSMSQLKENEMLRTKLKQLADQYTLAEQQYAHQLKQKELELQIADLKLKQHEEKLLQEQSQMKLYAEQVSQLLSTERNLRSQLTADGEKFEQFQEALVKSNEVFETFKQEIEKMAKSIKDLNKENAFLRSKSEKSDISLIELVGEREHLKKQLEKTRNQKEKLESLCRSLQAERKQIPQVVDNAGDSDSPPV